jgi:hypothetical protein
MENNLYNGGIESLYAGVETQLGGTWAQSTTPLCPTGHGLELKYR